MHFSAKQILVILELNRLVWILVSLQATLATDVTFRNHSCVPTGFPNQCFLNSLSYNPHDQRVIHVLPSNITHVRLGGEVTTFADFRFHHFDTKLYGMLGQPRILEVINLWVKTIELPRAVKHADFRKNIVVNMAIEPGEGAPLITFLDLSENALSNIANLSVLVNLEVLLLNNNDIKYIDPATMKNLTKLRHLDLTYNSVKQFSTTVFPKSLIYLNLYFNNLATLKYADLYFPSLEILNIERNKFNSIDASAMMLAMPSLKLARIGGNQIDPDDFRLAVQQFRMRNVSISDAMDEVACYFYEVEIEGVCVKIVPSRSAVQDFLMSFAVVLVAVLMVATVWWVFVAMNKKG